MDFISTCLYAEACGDTWGCLDHPECVEEAVKSETEVTNTV